MSADASTLADLPIGSHAVLGRPLLTAARTRRLAELGLRDGCEVHVVLRTPGGGRVVAVGEVRLALDRSLLGSLPVHSPVSPGQGTAP